VCEGEFIKNLLILLCIHRWSHIEPSSNFAYKFEKLSLIFDKNVWKINFEIFEHTTLSLYVAGQLYVPTFESVPFAKHFVVIFLENETKISTMAKRNPPALTKKSCPCIEDIGGI
jgi:hypothetical protein